MSYILTINGFYVKAYTSISIRVPLNNYKSYYVYNSLINFQVYNKSIYLDKIIKSMPKIILQIPQFISRYFIIQVCIRNSFSTRRSSLGYSHRLQVHIISANLLIQHVGKQVMIYSNKQSLKLTELIKSRQILASRYVGIQKKVN